MQKYLTRISVLTVSMSLASAFSACAQSIAYEGFSYPDGTQLFGTTPGQGDGGSGWATPWSATSAAIATNTASGLSYGNLTTHGGGVVMGNPTSLTFGTTASSQRLLPNTLGSLATAGSGTIWISFLYENWSTDNNGLSGFREAKLALFSGATTNANGSANVNGTERLDAGSPNTYAAGASDTLSLWSGSTFVSSGIATPRGATPADTVLILMELLVDNTSAADTAYAWFNPNLSLGAPGVGSAISLNTVDLSGVNALRFQAGNANANGPNAVFKADELRVGYSFADIAPVPEPMPLALVGLGSLALLALRRKWPQAV
jgi:hypothetical protein